MHPMRQALQLLQIPIEPKAPNGEGGGAFHRLVPKRYLHKKYIKQRIRVATYVACTSPGISYAYLMTQLNQV